MKIIPVIALLLLCSCKEIQVKQHCHQNSIHLDIPSAFRDSSYLNGKERILSMLKLPPLTDGFDEMQIRIWYGYPYSNVDHLLIFSKESGNWEGAILRIMYLLKAQDGVDTVIAEKMKATPKCGWTPFIDSLMNNELLALIDCDSILGYKADNNGNNFTVEFANCDNYRIYHYAEPWLLSDNFEGAKKVTKINEIIERQLPFQRLYIDK